MLLSILGKNLTKKGLRAGTQAQMMPILISSPDQRAMSTPTTTIQLVKAWHDDYDDFKLTRPILDGGSIEHIKCM